MNSQSVLASGRKSTDDPLLYRDGIGDQPDLKSPRKRKIVWKKIPEPTKKEALSFFVYIQHFSSSIHSRMAFNTLWFRHSGFSTASWVSSKVTVW